MGGPVVDEAKVARIQKLRRQGMSIPEIAGMERVSTGSVRRYTDARYRTVSNEASAAYRARGGVRLSMLERLERDRRDRRPLYDPKHHEIEPQSLTAELMGDPRPGRRAIVENVQQAESQRRRPWLS